MFEFNLYFTGYIDGRLHGFTCSRIFNTLPHPLQEDSFLLLRGDNENDDVGLVVTNLELKQHAGKLTTAIEWEIDTNFEGGLTESAVEKIRRALAFNGWSCEAHVI